MDRLDYTKGLVNRFKAFEKLLLLYPEFLERVMLLQVLGSIRKKQQSEQN